MLGIYTRISKDRDNQISTEVQKEQGIKLASTISLKYKLYEEAKGTSGGKAIKQRPKLNELVEDIYDGKITAVYFYNQDRSSRDELTWFTLANLFIEKKVSLYENGTLIDLEDEDTYMLAGFKAVMNASSRKKTGRKIKDALVKLVKDGKATNHNITYGYTKDDKGYLILNNEPINSDGLTEIDVVKRIFKDSLNGIGSHIIARNLNEEGVPTRYAEKEGTLTTKNKLSGTITTKKKSAVKWQQNTVLQILKKKWYYGKRTYKGEVYDVPALFTKDYCDRVKDNLTKNRKNAGKIAVDKYLLRGVLKCGCGLNMYGKVQPSNGENFYFCSSRRTDNKCGLPSVNRPHLDKIIWEWFFKNKTLVNLIKEHFEDTDAKQMIQTINEDLIKLKAQLKENETEKNKSITFATKGYITEEELDSQLKRIRGDKNKIDNDILNLENQLITYQNSEKSADEIIKDISQYKTDVSYNDRKSIIHKYIKDIVVDFKHKHFVIKIIWNLPQLSNYYLVVHRRCYYVIQPFAGYSQVIYKYQRKKKGKPFEQTNDEFFESVYKKQQALEVFRIKNELLKNEFGLPAIDFESSPETDAKLKTMEQTPEFIELLNKMKLLNKSS